MTATCAAKWNTAAAPRAAFSTIGTEGRLADGFASVPEPFVVWRIKT